MILTHSYECSCVFYGAGSVTFMSRELPSTCEEFIKYICMFVDVCNTDTVAFRKYRESVALDRRSGTSVKKTKKTSNKKSSSKTSNKSNKKPSAKQFMNDIKSAFVTLYARADALRARMCSTTAAVFVVDMGRATCEFVFDVRCSMLTSLH